MVEIQATYDGELRCTATHPSTTSLCTDAPKDNQGRGESFSPTDLVATALLTCMMTTMAIVAKRDGFELGTVQGRVEKQMSASPRRIAAALVVMEVAGTYSDEQRATLTRAARNCPVAKSLHPDVDGSFEIAFVG